MPHYDRKGSTDWAEIDGAADREICELDAMYSGDAVQSQTIVREVVTDCSFTNRKGEGVDPRQNYKRLTLNQWKWLREQIVKSSLDETIDPEA